VHIRFKFVIYDHTQGIRDVVLPLLFDGDVTRRDGLHALLPLFIVQVTHPEVCVHGHRAHEDDFLDEHVMEEGLDISKSTRRLSLDQDYIGALEKNFVCVDEKWD
jgi:hypothetical protein